MAHRIQSLIVPAVISLLTLPCISSAGWVEYVDTFTAPTNRWWIQEADTSFGRIQNGRYLYHGVSGQVSWGTDWMGIPEGDFDYELTLRISKGPKQSQDVQGIQFTVSANKQLAMIYFGLKDGPNSHFWAVNARDGNHRLAKYVDGKAMSCPHTDACDPKHPKLQKRTDMHLKMSRRGSQWELYQEGILVGKAPFEPFMGPHFGFGLHKCTELSIDNFVYRVKVPFVPGNEIVRVVGNVSWPGDKSNLVQTYVHKGDETSVSTQRTGTDQHLELALSYPLTIPGQSAGLRLQTQDGATLKVYCEPAKVHFVTLAGQKETGRKSVNLPAHTQGLRLTLDRRGDRFVGSYSLGTKQTLLGSLTWAKLSTQQQTQCFFGYKPVQGSSNTPESVTMSIKEMAF